MKTVAAPGEPLLAGRGMLTRRRRFPRGVVDPEDLKTVFERFGGLADGHMDIEAFGDLVRDLRLGLSDGDVRHLFGHLAEDVTVRWSNLFGVEESHLEEGDGHTSSDESDAEEEEAARALRARRPSLEESRPAFTPYVPPTINVDQFLAGLRRHRFLRRVVSRYAFPRLREPWVVREDYDYGAETRDAYGAPLEAGFFGALAAQRARLDGGWHGNYARERQLWQDAVVHAVALLGEETGQAAAPTKHPWLVLTCGAMGAGKGWVMNWMSQNEILPLRRIVHVDPDRFKQLMPEWAGYLAADASTAGTLCHRESATLAELAAELAMEQRVHVWVDGSLRDFDWYARQLETLRRRYPHYRVALSVGINHGERRPARDIFELLCLAQIELVFHDS